MKKVSKGQKKVSMVMKEFKKGKLRKSEKLLKIQNKLLQLLYLKLKCQKKEKNNEKK
jgi:hypothetical protein